MRSYCFHDNNFFLRGQEQCCGNPGTVGLCVDKIYFIEEEVLKREDWIVK